MITSNNYTAMRLILALMVLYSHSFALAGHVEPMIFSRSMGNFAVHCFFAISGYLIAGSFIKSSSAASFAIKRVFRIVPAFVIAYVFSSYAGKLQGAYTSNPVPFIENGSIWTLPWEMLMYLGVFALGVFSLLERAVLGSLLAVSLLLLSMFVGQGKPAADVIARLAILFLGGALLYLSTLVINCRLLGLFACLTLVVIFVPFSSSKIASLASLMPLLYAPETNYDVVRMLAYLVLLPYAIIYLCQYIPVSWPLKNDYSYGIYVFAWPIQQSLINLGASIDFDVTPHALFFSSTAVTVVVSALSWHLIEHPAINLGLRLQKRFFKRAVLNTNHGSNHYAPKIGVNRSPL